MCKYQRTLAVVIFLSLFLCVGAYSKGFSSKISYPDISHLKSDKNRSFSFGLGYQHLSWRYNVVRREKNGTSKNYMQSSDYKGLLVNLKITAFKPFGLFATIGLYFPFSITENFHIKNAEAKALSPTLIRTGEYLIKNIPSENFIKGAGIKNAIGFNYKLGNDKSLVDLGIGISWLTFVEDFYRSAKTISSLGFVLDGGYQFKFSDNVSVYVGGTIGYYPLSLFSFNTVMSSINSIVGDFILETEYFSEISSIISVAFAF